VRAPEAWCSLQYVLSSSWIQNGRPVARKINAPQQSLPATRTQLAFGNDCTAQRRTALHDQAHLFRRICIRDRCRWHLGPCCTRCCTLRSSHGCSGLSHSCRQAARCSRPSLQQGGHSQGDASQMRSARKEQQLSAATHRWLAAQLVKPPNNKRSWLLRARQMLCMYAGLTTL